MGNAQGTVSPRPDFIESQAESQQPPAQNSIDAETDLEVMRTVPKQFEITDEQSANWLLKRVMHSRAYAKKVRDWADQELRRAQREEHTLMFLYGRQLESWTRDQISKMRGSRKSICLPSATIGFRAIATRIVVDDETKVILWAKENLPTAVVISEHLLKSEINQYAERTGVIPDDGVHLEPASDRFFIR